MPASGCCPVGSSSGSSSRTRSSADRSLLLLDEPLANLDIASTQEIVELLDRICRERGIAVLLSAHDLNPLLPVMDRVVYLAGRTRGDRNDG